MSPISIGLILCGIAALICLEIICYVFYTPSSRAVPYWHPVPRTALLLYAGAHVLALFRLPYTILPYISKLLLFMMLRRRFRPVWDNGLMQGVRFAGDFVNFALLSVPLWALAIALPRPARWVLFMMIVAEGLRLAGEKGQMLWSGIWQILPHRQIAWRLIGLRRIGFIARYCAYYALPDADRLTYLLRVLRWRLRAHPAALARMAYVTHFRVVPDTHPLRQAAVRDVATGAIFIHQRWTNDPYLLLGLALRRSPWIFDPRYLLRPFYYRTQANPLMTLMVLEQAGMTPPFAWYQFGHEIKAARFDMFFRLCRRWNIDLEKPVNADGEYTFDPLLKWFAGESPQTPLLTDAQVLADMQQHGTPATALDLARRYTYPEKYVREVLLK